MQMLKYPSKRSNIQDKVLDTLKTKSKILQTDLLTIKCILSSWNSFNKSIWVTDIYSKHN